MENEINITYSVVAYSTTVEDKDNIIDSLNYCSSLSEILNFMDECDTTSRKASSIVDFGTIIANKRRTKRNRR